jgi:hypothetical protein
MKKSKLMLGTLATISMLLSTATVSANIFDNLNKMFKLEADAEIPSLS